MSHDRIMARFGHRRRNLSRQSNVIINDQNVHEFSRRSWLTSYTECGNDGESQPSSNKTYLAERTMLQK